MLNEIERQTDYLFIYNDEVNTNEKVSVKAKQNAVAKVLNVLLEKKSISYSMEGNHIILSAINEVKAKANETKTSSVQQQKRSITGTVVDVYGEPVIGANIVEVGTMNGTVTDLDGNFSLEVEESATLRISYIGYLEQTIATAGKTSVEVVLMEDTHALEEVIVIGYGTARKKDLSGAITNVKFDDTPMATLPNPNAFAALSSKVAGFHYLPTKTADGSNLSSMSVRGRNSIPSAAGDSQQSVNAPLIIVDGSIFYGSIAESEHGY